MTSFGARRRTAARVALFRAPVTTVLSSVVLLAFLVCIGCVGIASRARAADVPPRTATTEPAFRPARPYWLELTPPQRQALAPLASDWEYIDAQTKKKWVEIANRYPRMKPEDQSRSQERMREWALLTPEQRRIARDSFERVRAMPPEQRADMLRKYQELPPEKREALTHQGVVSKAIVIPRPLATAPETAVPKRTQVKEGASVRNPAVAAQKSASPVVAPAVPARTAAQKAPATTPTPSAVTTPAPPPSPLPATTAPITVAPAATPSPAAAPTVPVAPAPIPVSPGS